MKRYYDYLCESDYFPFVTGKGKELLKNGPFTKKQTKRLAQEITGDEMLSVNRSDDYLNVTDRSDEIDNTEFIQMNNRLTMQFRTDSQFPERRKGGDSKGDTFYTQKIRAPEFDNAFDGRDRDNVGEMSDDDIWGLAQLAVFDEDIDVFCDDPSMRFWGYNFITTQLDAREPLGPPENRFPDDRNPETEGTTCKHLHLVLETFDNTDQYKDDIVEAIRQQIRTGKFK